MATIGRIAREAARIATDGPAGATDLGGQWHRPRGAEPAVAAAPGTPQPQTQAFGTPDSAGRFTIDLTGLAIADGFIIQGDTAGDQAGFSVSSAGDVNNDGFDDIIVGAVGGDDGGSNAGEAYVIFGKATGFANLDLTTLSAADGFVIRGDSSGDQAGWSVGSADLNGDGFDEVIVGARVDGNSYVIFGRNTTFGAPDGAGRNVIDLTGLAAGDGFAILGGGGRSVSSAGDVNDDGYEDLILGDTSVGNEGAAWVIFGKASGLATINVATLAPADGFYIRGDASGDQAGFSVSSAGDINNDSYDDIIVGAPSGDDGGDSAGEAYVIFGRGTAFGTPDGSGRNFIDLTGLAASDGFIIQGDTTLDQAGNSVSSAGDINNDGYDDFIVGAPGGDDGGNIAGEAYVIFGHAGGFANIDLTILSPAAGFVIQGNVANDITGQSVSAAGDVNGDGYADIIVGAPHANGGGAILSGEATVLFGGANGFGTLDASGRNVIDISVLGAAQGFIIRGDAAGDRAGTSVSGAGDVNNDGYDDLLVGADSGDDGGGNAGEAYVIFGRATPGPNEPTEGNDDLTGTPGDDVIDALGGNDRIDALGGNDEIEGGAGADRMTGGTGDDLYYVDNAGDVIVEAAGEGNDTVRTSISYTLAAGVEVETLAARNAALTTPLFLTGNAFGQEITGNAGNNTLSAGGGIDTLRGLGGDDTYVPDADDIIVEAAGQGFDQVYVSATYVLAAGPSIEVLALVDLAPANLTGNEVGQQLIGNSYANTLDGGGGADGLYGLGGDDSYVVGSDDVIIENANQGFDQLTATTSYTLAAGVSVEMMSAADNGIAINLTGNELNQQLTGNGAANILNGGTGTDTLSGLGGDDLYAINSSDDVIVEAAGQGFDQAYVSANYTLAAGVAVEVLAVFSRAVVSGYWLTGNEFGQQIFGDNGANIIIGGGGTDSMLGFGGDDIYFLDGGDTVFEAVGEGFDQVITSADHVLSAGSVVEVLAVNDSTTTTSVNLTGNEFSQQISGNAGANILVAGGGADGLYGLGGDDIYAVDGNDAVIESAGQGFDQVYSATSFVLGGGAEVEVLAADTPTGTSELNLVGNEFGQQIFGNAGVNFLDGGGGGDALYGRGGADTFAFTTALGGGNVDMIADFSADDTIALENAVFTGLPAGPLSAGAFVVGAAAADADDRIVYNQATGQLFFDADGNGPGAQVQFALLNGAPVITASDFFVI